jgi:hypothetical protein
MFYSKSMSLGRMPEPYAILVNTTLIVRFPVVHSLLLTRKGGGVLARLAPSQHDKTLSTTTNVIIASVQLFAFSHCGHQAEQSGGRQRVASLSCYAPFTAIVDVAYLGQRRRRR